LSLLLAVDVGNTNIVLGAYQGERLEFHWRLSANTERTRDEFGILFHQLFLCHGRSLTEVNAVVIASVVPSLTPNVEGACRHYLGVEPLVVDESVDTGMVIKYGDPREVGPDRIVNALAARAKYGVPCVVVDFGTATTFDVVDRHGAYLGGAIAPGIGISVEALFRRAARLSKVPLVRPPRAIGDNTARSLQSGIIFGFAGQVDELVRRIARELGEKPRVIATGGFAELIAPECATVDAVDPLLTLEGLRLVHARHRSGGRGDLG